MWGLASYVGLCLVQAKEDTKFVLGRGRREHWVWGLVAGAVITGLALLVLSITRGNPAMFNQLDWYLARGWVFVFLVPGIFLGALLLAPFRLHRQQANRISLLTTEVERLMARLDPRLDIVFDPSCPGCRAINIRHPDGSTRPTVRLCVGVANTADVPAENVTVYVTALSDRRVAIPAALRRLEDTGWQGRVPQPQVAPVTLNPSGDRHHHFVLLTWRSGDMFADFFPASEASAVSIEARDLTGEIVVSNKVRPMSTRFALDVDHIGLSILRLG